MQVLDEHGAVAGPVGGGDALAIRGNGGFVIAQVGVAETDAAKVEGQLGGVGFAGEG